MINQDSKPTNEKGSTAVTVKPLCSNMEKPNMNMPILPQFGNSEQKTMGTREIANLCGKEHRNVKRDVQRAIVKFKNFSALACTYKDTMNRTQTEYLLDVESADLLLSSYANKHRTPLGLQEEAALKTIEQLLNISLIRQFRVGDYRIDGYDTKNNIAYEIDEEHHQYRTLKDLERQKFIEAKLGCKFLRIEV